MPPRWFVAQSLFVIEAGAIVAERGQMYEERITLWQAEDADDALAKARAESRAYANENGYEWVDYTTAYELTGSPSDGAEVWSFMRDSWLTPKQYVERFVTEGDPHAVPFDG